MKHSSWTFIGSLANENTDSRAISAAGQITQDGFLAGCIQQRHQPISILSMNMYRVFPYGKLFTSSYFAHNVQNVGFINLPIIKQISFSLNLLPRLLINKSDFIICYNPSFALIVVGYIFQLITKNKFIPMIYDIIIPGQNTGNKLLARLNYWAYRAFLKYFHVISISQPIIEDFNIKNSILIEGGLPDKTIQKFSAEKPKNRDLSSSFKLVFAGGLELENGIPQILKAMDMLKDENVELYLYGSGPLEKYVENSYSNSPNIHIMGQVQHIEVIEAIKNADLLLNIRLDKKISTKYFFPSKLIEYLSSGTPVLSTNFESMPVEYQKYIYLTEEDPQSIFSQIMKIKAIPDFQRTAYSHSGREWVLREKTWQSQSKKILDWASLKKGQTK